MNHRDFTRVVQKALGGTATEGAATLALDAVMRALTDGLAEDGEVRLAGFGSFRLRRYDTDRAAAPRTRLSFTPSRAHVRPARPEDRARLPRLDQPLSPAPDA